MIDIDKSEYSYIEGGLSVSSSLINAFVGGVKIILEIGRSLGSALRRGSSGKICSI